MEWSVTDNILTIKISNTRGFLIHAYFYDEDYKFLKSYQDTMYSDPIIFKFWIPHDKTNFFLYIKNIESETIKGFEMYKSRYLCPGRWVWELVYEAV